MVIAGFEPSTVADGFCSYREAFSEFRMTTCCSTFWTKKFNFGNYENDDRTVAKLGCFVLSFCICLHVGLVVGHKIPWQSMCQVKSYHPPLPPQQQQQPTTNNQQPTTSTTKTTRTTTTTTCVYSTGWKSNHHYFIGWFTSFPFFV